MKNGIKIPPNKKLTTLKATSNELGLSILFIIIIIIINIIIYIFNTVYWARKRICKGYSSSDLSIG